MNVRVWLLSLCLLLLATAHAGVSDTLRLDEVTVTAVKGIEPGGGACAATLIDMPQAERQHVVAIKDVATLVPNLHIPDYGSRMTSSIYVRGIGARIDQPAVGLNVDNIPVLCKENYDFDMIDLARAEVLRGPQSTLFGRNTMGGVINLYSLSPLVYQGTRFSAETGSHGLITVNGSHYARTSDRFAIGAAIGSHAYSGEFRNAYTGYRLDHEHQFNGRVRLEWLPADRWHVSNTTSLSVSRQGGYPYRNVEADEIAYNDTCFYRRTSLLEGLTVRRQADRLTLTGIWSYQFIDDNMTLDQDFTPEPYFTLTQKRREHGVTQEIVVSGLNQGAYHWNAGLFGFYRTMDMRAPVTFKDVGISELIESHVNNASPNYPIAWDTREFLLNSDFDQNTWGVAAYHQSSYRWKWLTFTAGLRVEYERSTLSYHSYTQTGYSILNRIAGTVFAHESIDIDDRGKPSKDFLQLLPRFSVVWKRDNVSVYALISRGSKAGGFNTQMFSDVLQQRLMRTMGIGSEYDIDKIIGYKPEKAWNFEIGGHFNTRDRRFVVDVSLFLTDCRDRQMTVFPDGTTTGRVMTNAGHTRNQGIEVGLHVVPWANGVVNVSYGYTDARFVRYDNGKADYRHRLVPYVPSHTLFAQALHEFHLSDNIYARSLTVNVYVNADGPIYWDEANTLRQPFYALLGASVTFAGRDYSVELWGKNLTGTKYDTFRFLSIGHDFLQRGRGRALGCTLKVQF